MHYNLKRVTYITKTFNTHMLNHMCAHMEACYTHVFLFNHMISKRLRLEICTCETLVPHVNVPKPHKQKCDFEKITLAK